MTLRFTKTTRADGVDGHFHADNPRVVVKPSEFPVPLHPEDAGYWDQFADTIVKACSAHDKAKYLGGVSPALEPIMRGNAWRAAELVHADWPHEIMTHAAQYISAPFRDFTGLDGKFTDRVVMLNHLMGWGAHMVSPSSFCAKWYFMAARPEEVAGAIARDEIEAPRSITLNLFDMVSRDKLITDQRAFAVYPEGSPDHPGYNAMHSAAAGAGNAVLKVLRDMSADDKAVSDLTAYNMAYFRSTAGVHTPQDNAVGLWLGQETVERLLPAKLAEYGVPASETIAALEANHVDWLAT